MQSGILPGEDGTGHSVPGEPWQGDEKMEQVLETQVSPVVGRGGGGQRCEGGKVPL